LGCPASELAALVFSRISAPYAKENPVAIARQLVPEPYFFHNPILSASPWREETTKRTKQNELMRRRVVGTRFSD
jgi:hypothetical protein